jgi:hypothetical protein
MMLGGLGAGVWLAWVMPDGIRKLAGAVGETPSAFSDARLTPWNGQGKRYHKTA